MSVGYRGLLYVFASSTDVLVEALLLSQVDLDELECSQDGEDGPCTFKFPCRCGGCYSVSEADLSHDSDHVLVQCQICSLVIKVLYTVAAFQDLAG